MTNSTPIINILRAVGLGAALMAAACYPAGEISMGEIYWNPVFMDIDSDSVPDGIDVEDDGNIDYFFASPPSGSVNALLGNSQCSSIFDMLLDDYDGDDILDAIDFNCDGIADSELVPAGVGIGGATWCPPPPGSGGGNGTGGGGRNGTGGGNRGGN
jgi:hypothetical protein